MQKINTLTQDWSKWEVIQSFWRATGNILKSLKYLILPCISISRNLLKEHNQRCKGRFLYGIFTEVLHAKSTENKKGMTEMLNSRDSGIKVYYAQTIVMPLENIHSKILS